MPDGEEYTIGDIPSRSEEYDHDDYPMPSWEDILVAMDEAGLNEDDLIEIIFIGEEVES